jgi:hypothetical protein
MKSAQFETPREHNFEAGAGLKTVLDSVYDAESGKNSLKTKIIRENNFFAYFVKRRTCERLSICTL